MAVSPSKVAVASPPLRYVLPNEIRPAENVRVEYRFTPEKAVAIEDLLKPKSWAHMADRLRVGDVIEAVGPDMAWHLRLLVRHIEAPEVFMGVLAQTRFEPLPTKEVAA